MLSRVKFSMSNASVPPEPECKGAIAISDLTSIEQFQEAIGLTKGGKLGGFTLHYHTLSDDEAQRLAADLKETRVTEDESLAINCKDCVGVAWSKLPDSCDTCGREIPTEPTEMDQVFAEIEFRQRAYLTNWVNIRLGKPPSHTEDAFRDFVKALVNIAVINARCTRPDSSAGLEVGRTVHFNRGSPRPRDGCLVYIEVKTPGAPLSSDAFVAQFMGGMFNVCLMRQQSAHIVSPTVYGILTNFTTWRFFTASIVGRRFNVQELICLKINHIDTWLPPAAHADYDRSSAYKDVVSVYRAVKWLLANASQLIRTDTKDSNPDGSGTSNQGKRKSDKDTDPNDQSGEPNPKMP